MVIEVYQACATADCVTEFDEEGSLVGLAYRLLLRQRAMSGNVLFDEAGCFGIASKVNVEEMADMPVLSSLLLIRIGIEPSNCC